MSLLLLNLDQAEINFHHTLINGQCFQWRLIRANEWVGVADRFVYRCVHTQTKSEVYLLNGDGKKHTEEEEQEATKIIKHYLNLDQSLTDLYKEWYTIPDKHLHNALEKCPGVRLLRQDPFECLISFICSSQNTVERIASMMNSFRETYGILLGKFENINWYQFPSVKQCLEANITVDALKLLKFGYRSGFIVNTINQLGSKSPDFLSRLCRSRTSKTSRGIVECLQQFYGIGPKVASCIALYSMECYDIVPIDVHMEEILNTHYTNLNTFQRFYGQHSGWVQSILFTAKVFNGEGKKLCSRKRKTIN